MGKTTTAETRTVETTTQAPNSVVSSTKTNPLECIRRMYVTVRLIAKMGPTNSAVTRTLAAGSSTAATSRVSRFASLHAMHAMAETAITTSVTAKSTATTAPTSFAPTTAETTTAETRRRRAVLRVVQPTGCLPGAHLQPAA